MSPSAASSSQLPSPLQKRPSRRLPERKANEQQSVHDWTHEELNPLSHLQITTRQLLPVLADDTSSPEFLS
ncbi:hypothetical protein BJX62DRAFT_219325 [Aspergillus germanicus]